MINRNSSQYLDESWINPFDFRLWMRDYMKQRERVRVPYIPYTPSQELAFSPSSVGGCPKQKFLERSNAPVTNPPSLHEEMTSLQRMDDGSRNQERFQEAFLWAASTGRLQGVVSIEQAMSLAFYDEENNDKRLVRGRADVIVNDSECMHIIEIKRRDTFKGKLQPKQSDIDQLAMYRAMQLKRLAGAMPNVRMYLIISEREFYEMWRITITSRHDGYVFVAVSERDEKIEFEYRTPVEIIEAYTWYPMSPYPEVPITDYLNDPNGWMCCKQHPKPKALKTKSKEFGEPFNRGKAKINCPYFKLCHGESAKRFATGLTTDGRIVRVADLPDEEEENDEPEV